MLICQGMNTQDAISSAVNLSFPALSSATPQFWSDICFFRGSEGHTQIEFYYSLASRELKFEPIEEKNRATFSYSLIIKNSQNQTVVNQNKRKQLQVASAEEIKDVKSGVIDQLIFDLKPGNYQFEFKISDELDKKSSSLSGELLIPAYDDQLSISSPQFASRISADQSASPFLKGNKTVIPNTSRKYVSQKSYLYLYFEIYNLQAAADQSNNKVELSYAIVNLTGDTLLFLPAQTIAKPGNSCIKTQLLNIFGFEPGEYRLSLKAKDLASGSVAAREKNFWVVEERETISVSKEDIKRYRDQIKYFASDKELNVFDMLQPNEIESFLINFWHQRDTSPETPENEFMLDVFTRIDYADKNFKGSGSGLNSDMGRVFVIYGQPDEIENFTMNMEGKPYIIWNYFTSSSGKHYFVFIDKNIDGHYTLVHSSVVTEIKNEFWREQEL
jgi:GWxTD domain-containing protein